MPVTYCDVFGFLWRSMACFFDCFRPHNDRHPRPVLLPNSSPKEEVSGKIRLSSLFAADEREECVAKDRESLVRRVGRSEFDEGLLEEVKLLKACGTLPQTPAEIRKTVKFSESTEKSDLRVTRSALISSPQTPVADQLVEALPENLESEHSSRPQSAFRSSPETPEEGRDVESPAEIAEKSDVRGQRTVQKASPYPTPRKITDDMQTPGTVYATNMKSLTEGDARIRSQYVYTVLNPIENLCQLEELKEKHTVLQGLPDHEGENLFQLGDATPTPAARSRDNSIKEETVGDASLSAWLKPPPAYDDDDCPNLGTVSCKKPNFGRTPGDRPILGLVASHWNDQEDTSHSSPKWWDGNGIPNSTTKYKEDQKVRWHATPFEERLEKALSEETCAPIRKPIIGGPIIFEDTEGQDTATSQLPSVPKPVASF